MSFSTDLYTSISFNRETYDTKYKIEEALDEARNGAEYCKTRLHQLAAMTDPQKFCSEEEDPLIWLTNEVDSAITDLEDYTKDIYKLELLLECFDEAYDKEKKCFKKLPVGVHWDSSFISGDFIKTEGQKEL